MTPMLLLIAGCVESHATLGPIETCGVDIEELSAGVGPGLAIVGHVCADLEPGRIAAWGDSSGRLQIDEIKTELISNRFVWVSVHRFSWSSEGLLPRGPGPCELWFEVEPSPVAIDVVDVGLSPGGTLLHVGVNVRGDTGGRALGLVFDADCGATELPLAHHGAGTILTDSPNDWLVSGASRDGVAGIFRAGNLEVPTPGRTLWSLGGWEGHVLASEPRGHGENTVHLWDSDLSLIASAWGGFPLMFSVAQGRGLIRRTRPSAAEGFVLYEVSIGARTTLNIDRGDFLASTIFSAVVPVMGTRRLLLQHDRGLLVVE